MAARGKHPADLDRKEYLRSEMLRMQRLGARMAKAGSYQALVGAARLQLQLRAEYDALVAAEREAAFDPNNLDHVVDKILMLGPEVLAHPRLRAACRE